MRHQVSDPVGDDPGFSGARSSQHQQRPPRVLHRLSLLGIQYIEVESHLFGVLPGRDPSLMHWPVRGLPEST